MERHAAAAASPHPARHPYGSVERETAPVNPTPWARRLVIWGSATGMALLLARTTRVGPAFHLWGTHGVHLGDLAAFALAYAWAATLTIRRRPGR